MTSQKPFFLNEINVKEFAPNNTRHKFPLLGNTQHATIKKAPPPQNYNFPSNPVKLISFAQQSTVLLQGYQIRLCIAQKKGFGSKKKKAISHYKISISRNKGSNKRGIKRGSQIEVLLQSAAQHSLFFEIHFHVLSQKQ